MPLYEMIFWLAAGHFIADFTLQSDFIAQKKAPGASQIWPWVLSAHAATHAAAVALILGPAFGLAEFAAHWATDYAKSRGLLGKDPSSFHIDQALHLAAKGVWLAAYLALNTPS